MAGRHPVRPRVSPALPARYFAAPLASRGHARSRSEKQSSNSSAAATAASASAAPATPSMWRSISPVPGSMPPLRRRWGMIPIPTRSSRLPRRRVLPAIWCYECAAACRASRWSTPIPPERFTATIGAANRRRASCSSWRTGGAWPRA